MFSKEESKRIRQEFWTSFGKAYPRKWVLYNTKIKDVSLKFTFTTKKAEVSIDIEPWDDLIREYYYDKLLSLEKLLSTEYIPDIVYDPEYELDNGKILSRVYCQLLEVSIHNKNSWLQTMEFLYTKMDLLETFFTEYKDFIKD